MRPERPVRANLGRVWLCRTGTLLALVAALVAGGCGWAEWPPPSRMQAVRPPPGGGVVQAPAPRPTSRTADGSDAVFVGADSVIVGRGDTVYGISQRHGVSARAIIDANRLTPPYELAVGQRLMLPRDRVHTVARGDTLYGISRAYGVDMYALARANSLAPPYTIIVGQKLRVPASFTTASVQPAAVSAPVRSAAPAPRPAPTGPAVTMVHPQPKPTPPPAAPASPPPASGKGFLWPIRGKVILAFGPEAKGRHNDGINIAAPRGTAVRAAENGVVAYAGNEIRGFGNLLLIKHAGGWITAYAHNEQLLVKRGDRVTKGQVIARVGSSGNVTSPQLHFELRRGRVAVDPAEYLSTRRIS